MCGGGSGTCFYCTCEAANLGCEPAFQPASAVPEEQIRNHSRLLPGNRNPIFSALLSPPVCNFATLRIDWDRVPRTRVVLYREEDGSCPFLEWFSELSRKAQDEEDFLRDGIYELRVSLQGVQYRILYFFHGTVAAVVSHGLVKERVVPSKEIDRAVERKRRFGANPRGYTYQEV